MHRGLVPTLLSDLEVSSWWAFFLPTCPNSKETLGGKQIHEQGADRKSFH